MSRDTRQKIHRWFVCQNNLDAYTLNTPYLRYECGAKFVSAIGVNVHERTTPTVDH
jgi:hypothetical protein